MPTNGLDYATALPGGVLRFAVFVPFGIYHGMAENHWHVIKKHSELQGDLYSSAIGTGEKLAARWGQFGFYWSFAAWIPAFFTPSPFNIVFGIIDAVVVVYMSIATHYQTSYNPQHINSCKDGGAHLFQLPPGTNESFFEAAARLNATTTSPFQMCKSFVEEWQYGIALSTIYAFIALLNITLCTWACFISYRDSRRQNKPYWRTVLHSLAEIPKFVFILIVAFLYYIPYIFFQLLPIPLKSRIRFARRCGVKAAQGLEEKSEMQMKKLKRRVIIRDDKTGKYISKGDGEQADLADFLGIYDMLILVVQNLHYMDVVNLGLVSKSVREAVLPADEYSQRMTHFKMYTCHSRSKKQCWICRNQICNGCKQLPSLTQTTPYFHMDQCRPFCTKCYFAKVQNCPIPIPANRTRTKNKVDPRHCACAPPTATPNIFQRYLNGADFYASRQTALPHITRSVCRECNKLCANDLMDKREQRTKWELGEGCAQREGMQKCRACEKELGNGPRWWVCKLCKKECRNLAHGAWGKRIRGKGIGEQAV